MRTQTPTRRRGRKPPTPFSDSWRAWTFLAPGFLLCVLFLLAPAVYAIWTSFQPFDVAGRPLGGLTTGNYEALRQGDFARSMWITLGFMAVKIPVQVALGLGLALLLQGTRLGNRIARSVVLIPGLISYVVAGVLFTYFFDGEIGLANTLLNASGLESQPWLTEPHHAQLVVFLVTLWRDTGLIILVFVAGLAAIPSELHEAITVDGASRLQSFHLVTLPMLRRSMQFATVLVTLVAAQVVVPIFVLTRGGPRDATRVAAYAIYENSFQIYDWGPATAMSVVLLVVVLAITGAELFFLRDRRRSA